MNALTAPALLIGLGARILLDQVAQVAEETTIRTAILPGAWQGVALSYAHKEYEYSLPAACLIAAKLYIEYVLYQDTSKAAISLVGIILGYFTADVLSGMFDATKEKKTPSSSLSRKKSSTFRGHTSDDRGRDRERSSHRSRANSDRTSQRSRKSQSRKSQSSRHTSSHQTTTSDITEVNTDSEMVDPKGSMSPIERQVAALRARASLADSERRRFKEEKKWAQEMGNTELATELGWQYKRYSALMKSFHREADTKLMQAQLSGSPCLTTIEEQSVVSREVPIALVDLDLSHSQAHTGLRVH
ncbi:hypothetical protein CYLTODRAFT_484740 [Cylindrobasidium torrendii FP15055 ss-10]|uniref:Uncharacterized protein n=1 Tax=Cylindrobasidium torrendii FP15055 ss-10 TaxID=1314674 RepID=A0A0D7BW59_9AGAR|nr:hypothetical protein CYLTODRAFT_484740 [Cylindrobasidium torrendii FP15055 ss-10]